MGRVRETAVRTNPPVFMPPVHVLLGVAGASRWGWGLRRICFCCPCFVVCGYLYDYGPGRNGSVLDVASWRLVMWSIANLLRVACFLFSVCLEPFY